MNAHPGNERAGLSMEWVKRQLKAISAVEPPRSLQDRLEAGLPGGLDRPITRRVWLGSRRFRWAGAAAVLLLGASAAVWLGSPWGRQIHSAIDTNIASGRVYATDHNSLRPADTNVCDFNALR